MTEQALTADTLHAPGLRLWDYEQLLSAQLQAREMLLAPLLPEKSLCMVYAARGIEKTYLALSIAHAVASGGKLLGWEAPEGKAVFSRTLRAGEAKTPCTISEYP